MTSSLSPTSNLSYTISETINEFALSLFVFLRAMSRISRRGHLRKEIIEMQDAVMQRDREELQTGGRGAQPGPGNGEVAYYRKCASLLHVSPTLQK